MEPMPPMTMHQHQDQDVFAHAQLRQVIGPSSAPATAASIAPGTNTPETTAARAPISVAICRLGAPAYRTPAPARVTNQYRPTSPNTMIIKR